MYHLSLKQLILGTLGITAFLLIVFGLLLSFGAIPLVAADRGIFPTDEVSSAASGEKTVGEPMRLIIPGIRVNAAVEKIALTRKKSLDVPKDPMDAGWYSLGPRPGEPGSAVIDGHVNWYHGESGVFEKLRQLAPGDTLMVEDTKGRLTSFVVNSIHTYNPNADATNVFHSADGNSHLNLITCDGVWDSKTGQYSQRLVVFTTKVTK